MILTNVTKNYGKISALRNVNAEIGEGEITAVLGESGAGKTTLLNAIAGLVEYEGRIDGAPENCAYLFQDACLLPNLTAEGNLKFALPKSGWDRIGEALARVGLAGREKAYPHELSGGEKQRVAVARAFLYPHTLLLMDEPFSSLDLSLKKSMTELIVSLWEKEKNTILFVTHDVHEAAILARRAIVLRHGEMIADIPVSSPYPRDFYETYEEERALVRALTGD